jgi:tRNA nucleotidyltransferase (CCA-adding enzyme)
VYPYPAANPEVSPSSIYADLYRRDFTVNAMAIRLTPPHAGELLDLMGGVQDLEAKYLRVLHPNSFIDDPTRIYRGVRFAARLGFQFEPQTEAYIREAIASGIYWQGDLQPDGSRIVAPALQTRLRAELMYLLRSPEWKVGLALLANLDALRCIHPTLTATPTLWRQLRHLDHYYHWFQRNAVDFPSSLWLARLEVILAQLAAGDRAPVAETLQLPLDSITRLHQLAAAEANISVVLLTCQHPSQIMGALCSYDRLLLGLVAIRSNRCLRRLISRYLGHWSAIKPLLDGNDLKALGYRPSPQFKQMLDKLTAATADGQVLTRADAEQFLCRNFPLSKY